MQLQSPAKSPKRLPPPPVVSRVRVAVRVRPPVKDDGDAPPPLCIENADPESERDSSENSLQFQHEKTRKKFQFDHVFSTESAQSDVYNEALEPMLASLLHGFNVTVLAYGQTGSGKTYTMGGAAGSWSRPGDNDGLIPRFICDLFAALRSEPTVKSTARVTFLEIYCDEIRDLLVERSESCRSSGRRGSVSALTLHEDATNVWVDGLQQVQVKTVEEALHLLNAGRQRQTTAAHALNDQSSRSHAVYTLEVSRAFATEIKRAKLTFVDLAGSERIKKTMVERLRKKESIQINVGLLALGTVINALGNQQQALQRRNSTGLSGRRSSITGSGSITPVTPAHVPYRSSKLTRLLRDALGGNSVTLFIACISPEAIGGSETLSTLQYANRARSIQNRAHKNVEDAVAEDVANEETSVKRGSASEREVYALRAQVVALKLQLEQAVAAAKAAEDLADANRSELRSPKSTKPLSLKLSLADDLTAASDITVEVAGLTALIEVANATECSLPAETGKTDNFYGVCTDAHAHATAITAPPALELCRIAHHDAEKNICDEPTQTLAYINVFEKFLVTDKASEPPFQISIGVETLPPQIQERSTQYEPSLHLQNERITPLDYVLLSPSQIFREVHHQKQIALAGAPSPWPRRRRLDGRHIQLGKHSTKFFTLDVNDDTSNQQCTADPTTSNVLHDLLQHTQRLMEGSEYDNEPEFDNSEDDEVKRSPLSLGTFVDRMTTLFEERTRRHQLVHRLIQRFRHLSNLLGAADTEANISEIFKYTLTHQQNILQEYLNACELLAAERLWTRLQHREVAEDNCNGDWDGSLDTVFLSEDQYDACQPWHAHLDNHEFFQHRVLPYILNGWISVASSDLDSENLWLAL